MICVHVVRAACTSAYASAVPRDFAQIPSNEIFPRGGGLLRPPRRRAEIANETLAGGPPGRGSASRCASGMPSTRRRASFGGRRVSKPLRMPGIMSHIHMKTGQLITPTNLTCNDNLTLRVTFGLRENKQDALVKRVTTLNTQQLVAPIKIKASSKPTPGKIDCRRPES